MAIQDEPDPRRDGAEAQGDDPSGGVPAATLDVLESTYQAIIDPRRFSEMLDLWSERINSLGPERARELNLNLERHLETALPMLERAADTQLAEDDVVQLVHVESRPALALSTSLVVVAGNDAAAQKLGLVPGDQASAEAFEPRDWETLQDFARAARTGPAAGRPPDAAADAAPADGPGHCVVKFYTPSGHTMLVDIAAKRAADTGAASLLLRGFELVLTRQAHDILRAAFALTDAENDIIAQVLEGFGPAEIAAIRRTSVETVRTQLKAIREKTGARSQVELLRMVAGLSSLDEAEKLERATVGARMRQAYRLPRHHAVLDLRSGRRLEYVRLGPPDGKALIVNHAVLFGFRWPEALTRPLLDAGYALHFPVRAGYGLSSPAAPSMSFDQDVDDITAYADAFGLDSYGVIGQGVSAGIAMALCARQGNRVRAAASLAGYLPLDLTDLLRDMTPWQRTTLHVARVSPRMILFFSRAALKMMGQIGPREFYLRTYANSPSDRSVAEDPEKLALLQSSYDLVRAQGLQALALDFQRVVADWKETMDAVRRPSLLIHGDQKQIISPDLVRRFCDGRDALDFSLVEGAGQMLAHSHPETVAARLLDHFAPHF